MHGRCVGDVRLLGQQRATRIDADHCEETQRAIDCCIRAMVGKKARAQRHGYRYTGTAARDSVADGRSRPRYHSRISIGGALF